MSTSKIKLPHNIPSFSLVRYQQGWLVVFRTFVSSHCQVVYAYMYRGSLLDATSTDTPQLTITKQ